MHSIKSFQQVLASAEDLWVIARGPRAKAKCRALAKAS
jgi:hypothetical protein